MNPIRFDVDYAEERNRLTVFFRLIVAIPWLIWLSLYGIVALLAAIGAWFAMLFTKRYPEGLYDFVAGYVKLSTQIGGFALLLTDEWPPFMPDRDDYPVRVEVAPQQVEYRRAHTFFKYVLAFPQQLIMQGLSYVIYAAAFVTWWRVLVTGKQSATMHDALRMSVAYSTRAGAFLLLLTETHPRILDLPPQAFPATAPSLPGPEQLPVNEAPLPAQTTPPEPPPPAPPPAQS
ncbi:MAG: DUF4389 domain-containing protein [Solirubrobacterales bacterium]